jgi:hypothetical protein
MHGALQGHHLDFMREQTYGTNCELRLMRSTPNTPRETLATPTNAYHIQNRPMQKDADANQMTRLLMTVEAVSDTERAELNKCNRVEFDVNGSTFAYEVNEFPPLQIIGTGWNVVLNQINPTFS